MYFGFVVLYVVLSYIFHTHCAQVSHTTKERKARAKERASEAKLASKNAGKNASKNASKSAGKSVSQMLRLLSKEMSKGVSKKRKASALSLTSPPTVCACARVRVCVDNVCVCAYGLYMFWQDVTTAQHSGCSIRQVYIYRHSQIILDTCR